MVDSRELENSLSLRISVLTPSMNSGKYISRAIESVCAQDYEHWEHIIVDGGSVDETVEILKGYNHIKWVSETDRGQSDAMNKAFKMSTGDVIVYLNADDWFSDGAFSAVANMFIRQPDVDFIYGKLVKVFKDHERVFVAKSRLSDILRYWPCVFPGNPVSYFYKRHVQESIGPFPIDNHFTMDYWFLLRVYRRFNVGYIDRVLGSFQCFDNKSSDVERAKKNLREVRDEFLREFPSERLKLWYHNLARKLLK